MKIVPKQEPTTAGARPGCPRQDSNREFVKALRAAELAAWEAAFPETMTVARETGRAGRTWRRQAILALGATAIVLGSVMLWVQSITPA